jgi:hypothetical protein
MFSFVCQSGGLAVSEAQRFNDEVLIELLRGRRARSASHPDTPWLVGCWSCKRFASAGGPGLCSSGCGRALMLLDFERWL